MRAITFYEYGSPAVLNVEERAAPVCGPGQVLVRVRSAALNAADWRILRASPFLARFAVGLLKPRYNVLGCDFAGVIEAAGPDVTSVRVGDEVMGELGSSGWGAFAEVVRAPEVALVKKPSNIGFDEAAAAPLAGVTALQALLRKGELRSGERVLLLGASGGVGTFAVQWAKVLGAHVTAVCSERNVEQARSLGADEVINYSREDFAAGGRLYDLVVAMNGDRSLSQIRRVLTPAGRYVMSGGSGKQLAEAILVGPLLSLGGRQQLGSLSMKSNHEDLALLRDRLADGSVRSVIDRTFPFEQVREALEYLEEGHATGKVVLHVS